MKRVGAALAVLLMALAVTPARAEEGFKPVPKRYRDRPVDAKLSRPEKGSERLSDLRGKPVLLKLWATWCEPCREQDSILESLHEEIEKRGVTVVAIDEGEKPDDVRAYLEKTPSPHPVLLDPYQKLAGLFDVGALPYLAMLRSDGTVAMLYEGLLQRDGVLKMLEAAAPAK